MALYCTTNPTPPPVPPDRNTRDTHRWDDTNSVPSREAVRSPQKRPSNSGCPAAATSPSQTSTQSVAQPREYCTSNVANDSDTRAAGGAANTKLQFDRGA